jgi:two-component system sensor histidine kinase KdpD
MLDRRTGVVAAICAVTLLTAALAPIQDRVGLLNVGLVFILLTLLISVVWEWPAGLFAALINNLALNFFFVPPLHRFAVRDAQDVTGLVLFLIVSAVGSFLLSRARLAAVEARQREAETHALLRLNRAMIARPEPSSALDALCEELTHAYNATAAAVIARRAAGWDVVAFAGDATSSVPPDPAQRAVAEQAIVSGSIRWHGPPAFGQPRRIRIIRPALRRDRATTGTSTVFAPLLIAGHALGVLRLEAPAAGAATAHPRLLEAFAIEAALALQRYDLSRDAAHAEGLRETDRMKNALITSISHDLKTPLAAIKTAVGSLLDESVAWTAADRAAFLQVIDTESDRLDAVISDILDLNRVESGALQLQLRPVHVATLIEDARERTAHALRGRPLHLDVSDDLWVTADESLLLHALVNLLQNAAKFSPADAEIRVSAHAFAANVTISVEDNGPGVLPEDLPHVFERFYRSASRQPGQGGSGLGLAIVKAFVELSGGSVGVENTRHGATFWIKLPAREGVPA